MSLILFAVFGIINALIAAKKGFNPWIWFFAAGLLGLVVVSIMPSASAVFNENFELSEQRRKNGNTAGLIILGVAFVLIMLMIGLR
jgi:MFS family permease